MPSDFRDFANTQREVARVLRRLTDGLQRSTPPGRLAAPSPRPAATGAVREAASLGASSQRDRQQGARQVLSSLASVLGQDPSAVGRTPTDIARALNRNTQSARNLDAAISRNTDAIRDNSSALASGLRGLVGGLGLLGQRGGGGFLNFLTGGFGLAGLGARIAGLFGGSDETEAVINPFRLPDPISVEAANRDGILTGFPRTDRSQSGAVRQFSAAAEASAPQVVVNVNALDTQSFLDRSEDIAQAVRNAMLHMHPVNDLIGEV